MGEPGVGSLGANSGEGELASWLLFTEVGDPRGDRALGGSCAGLGGDICSLYCVILSLTVHPLATEGEEEGGAGRGEWGGGDGAAGLEWMGGGGLSDMGT